MLFLKRQVPPVGMLQPIGEEGLDGLHMSVITLAAVDFRFDEFAAAEAAFVSADRGLVNAQFGVYGN
ncbi:hypothetical protein [Hyphomicrobium sp. 802]|nr:hypothetical protein [Hyphomicrobium sp. 802]